MDDPAFVRPIPRNSWGGASQALTALRAPRWMEFYGKSAELGQMMQAWCDALMKDGMFRQQLDPMTGIFTEGGSKGYSPAALVLVDSTCRLAGVREEDGRMECERPAGLRGGGWSEVRAEDELGIDRRRCGMRTAARICIWPARNLRGWRGMGGW